MPYKSKKQRAYLHIHEPELANKWDAEYGGKIEPEKKPRRERPISKRSKKRKNRKAYPKRKEE